MAKDLEVKILGTKELRLAPFLLDFALRLDHDGPILFGIQGQMSQAGSESRALRRIAVANAFDSAAMRLSTGTRTHETMRARAGWGRAQAWAGGPQRLKPLDSATLLRHDLRSCPSQALFPAKTTSSTAAY
jgi:hypothetical protein